MMQHARRSAEARSTFKPTVICLGAAVVLAGCASVDEAPGPEWTDADEIAYQQCLQNRMAEAVAWEMIEQSCRNEVEGAKELPSLE